MPEDHGADDRAHVVEHCKVGDHAPRHLVFVLQKIRIKVLRPMREEHEQSHEDHQVGEQSAVLRDGAENGLEIREPVLFPGFRLRNLGPDIKGEQRGDPTDPEHPAPTGVRRQIGKDEARRDRREQRSHRVAALKDAAEQPTPARRSILHRQRRAYAPFATHPDPIEAAQDEERFKIWCEAARESDRGEKEHVADERHTASVTVGEHAKDEGAHRTKCKSRRRGPEQMAFWNLEVGCQYVVQKKNDCEIKGIERPAKISGGDGVPLPARNTWFGHEGVIVADDVRIRMMPG
jgi:hypothetical protein